MEYSMRRKLPSGGMKEREEVWKYLARLGVRAKRGECEWEEERVEGEKGVGRRDQPDARVEGWCGYGSGVGEV